MDGHMELNTEASRSVAGRRNTLYAIGLVVVGLLDAALALLLAFARAHAAANQNTAEMLGYTVGYAGCSLLFCLGTIAGAALLIARLFKKPFGAVLLRTTFWSALTAVPFFLLLLFASWALRQG